MNFEEALSGRAGQEGLVDLLRAPEWRSALCRELKALLSVPEMLGPCHLRGVRFRLRPEVKLAASFDVSVLRENGGGYATRAVAVTLKPRWVGKLDNEPARPEVTALENAAIRRGVAQPFRRLTTQAPTWGMRVQVSPMDVCFPQLVRLCDPNHVAQMIATLREHAFLRPGRWPQGRYSINSIRYYPGDRHVLRYEPAHRSRVGSRHTVFAKIYHHGDAHRISSVLKEAALRLAGRSEGVSCLQPLALVPEDNAILYPLISGTPLHQLLWHPHRETGRQLELAGRALRALHAASALTTRLLPPHSFEAEIKDIEEKSHFLSALLPSVASQVDSHLRRAEELYAQLPKEPPTFTHGDVRAEHIWTTLGGLTLMDFDACQLADPAQDIGQFLADVRLWYDTYGQSSPKRAQARFLAGYAPGVPSERLARARLYETIELVRVAARRVPLTDRDWAARTERLVRRAVALLNDLGQAARQRLPRQASHAA
jgi:hypothetical protein